MLFRSHGDVDYVELIDCNGIVCGSGDCSSKRHGYDHGNIGFSQYDCDDDGESGRVERNTVTDESVTFVGR